MKLGWTDEMYRVERVRAHKRVLSGHMSHPEIAAALGVSVASLRSYSRDPDSPHYRAIPEAALARLHALTLSRLEQTLEVYRAAA